MKKIIVLMGLITSFNVSAVLAQNDIFCPAPSTLYQLPSTTGGYYFVGQLSNGDVVSDLNDLMLPNDKVLEFEELDIEGLPAAVWYVDCIYDTEQGTIHLQPKDPSHYFADLAAPNNSWVTDNDGDASCRAEINNCPMIEFGSRRK